MMMMGRRTNFLIPVSSYTGRVSSSSSSSSSSKSISYWNNFAKMEQKYSMRLTKITT